jgi:hypothetical protein
MRQNPASIRMSAQRHQSVLIALALVSSVGTASASCPQAKNDEQAAVPSREVALKVAKKAWVRKNPEWKLDQRDFQNAVLERGVWYVYAAMERGQRGGGRPGVSICAATGQAVRMSLSR